MSDETIELRRDIYIRKLTDDKLMLGAEVEKLRAEIASYKNDQVLHSATRRSALLDAAKMAKEAMFDEEGDYSAYNDACADIAAVLRRAAEGVGDE